VPRTRRSASFEASAVMVRCERSEPRTTALAPQDDARPLMPARLHDVAPDRGLAELLAGLEPVQPLDEHEALAVRPHQDRRLLPLLQHALGDRAHARRVERRPALHRHIDVRDREHLGLEHRSIVARMERSVISGLGPAVPAKAGTSIRELSPGCAPRYLWNDP